MGVEDTAIHMVAILVAALFVRGCMEGVVRWHGWAYYMFRAACWSGVVGGGTYGLALLDSGVLPVWSWASLLVCMAGTLILVSCAEVIIRHRPLASDDIGIL